jgi:AraC-like DNA-binding protein
MKETLWLKKLVEVASKSTKTIFNISNEYSYINNAITKISTINEEQLCKIQGLNNSIKNSVVKSLLILGVYTENEKKEVESYFNNSFENFCVAKVNYRIDESVQVDKTMQQNILLEIENTFKTIIKNEFIALNLLSKESIFVIFFDEKENNNVNIIKNQLTELIRATNLNSQIPITINIGLSSIMYDIKNAKTAYQQAKYAISINENYVSSGVYVYEPIQEYSYKKDFDIAVLIKLYDAIVAGEKSIVAQIFTDNYKKITRWSLTEQEQLQIFFSFRQTVYNTHKVIVNERFEVEQQSNLVLPEYNQISDIVKLFNELNSISMNLCDIVINNKKSNNEKLKVDIVEYINKNYSDINLSASSIATELLISEKYVFSFVKEQTGKSLGKFIEEVRIINAERLLYETDYSNSQILKLCGFGSENTFYRAFSKKHSVSPIVWRENKRNITI